jgi:hypothetical protein
MECPIINGHIYIYNHVQIDDPEQETNDEYGHSLVLQRNTVIIYARRVAFLTKARLPYGMKWHTGVPPGRVCSTSNNGRAGFQPEVSRWQNASMFVHHRLPAAAERDYPIGDTWHWNTAYGNASLWQDAYWSPSSGLAATTAYGWRGRPTLESSDAAAHTSSPSISMALRTVASSDVVQDFTLPAIGGAWHLLRVSLTRAASAEPAAMLKVARTPSRFAKGTFPATSRGRMADSYSTGGKESVMVLPGRSCAWWKKMPVSATFFALQLESKSVYAQQVSQIGPRNLCSTSGE